MIESLIESLHRWQYAIRINEPLTLDNRIALCNVLEDCEKFIKGAYNEEQYLETVRKEEEI